VPAAKSIASRLVRKGHNSITCFGVCLGQPHSHLRLLTGTPTILEVFKGPIADLPATIFLSIVLRVLGNSR